MQPLKFERHSDIIDRVTIRESDRIRLLRQHRAAIASDSGRVLATALVEEALRRYPRGLGKLSPRTAAHQIIADILREVPND